jgi:hypothetical protein
MQYDVWDVRTGRVIAHRPDTSSFWPYIFSPDGKLAAGMRNIMTMDKTRGVLDLQPEKSVRILDVTTGRQLLSLPQPDDEIADPVAFSPDTQTLLTETQEEFWEGNQPHYGKHTFHFWELRSGKERLTIPGEKSGLEFRKSTFSSDGRIVAAAREDWTIQLWEMATGKELVRRSGYDSCVSCLAISPDGKTLASGHFDGTILVWDISKANRPVAPKGAANPKDLENWWDDLAGADAKKANIAIWEMADRPEQAVPLLRDRLKPAAAVTRDQIRQLLRDLDSKEFKTREAASKRLANLPEDVEAALTEALKASTSAEQRRRIEALLAAPCVLPRRAVEVLEHIGTPEAQDVLTTLGKGAPEARVTREAKASLERLGKREFPKASRER